MTASARALARRLASRLASGTRGVLDSPLVELDTRELLASWRTGAILGFLVLVIGLATLAAGAASGEAPFHALVVRFGMGHYLVTAAQLALATALTLAVPLRASGAIEGPRWRGFFDQLVTSGVRPWEYFLGRALASQAFLALAFVGTAPLFLAVALADPPPLATLLENHALLLVYAELLLVTTLGLSALLHDVGALSLTVSGALILGAVSLLPVPSALVALSPVRAITGPFASVLADVSAAEAEVLYGPARLFEHQVPLVLYGPALALVVGALAVSCWLVGRPHAFAPGYDNFGAVVLQGDRRRAAVLRFRPVLVRRSELAFFFENHGPLHALAAPWARLGRAAIVLGLGATLALGALWNTAILSVVPEHLPLGFFAAGLAFGGLALASLVYLSSARPDAPIDLALGRWRVPMVLADLALYALLATALLALFDRTTSALLPSMKLPAFPLSGTPFRSAADVIAAWHEWGEILAVTGFALLLLQKLFGLRIHDAAAAGFIALALVAATGVPLATIDLDDLKPTVPARLRPGNPDEEPREERSPEQNELTVAGLHLCPIFRLRLMVDATVLDEIPLPRGFAAEWLAHEGFWALYPALELLLLLAVLQLLRERRREARLALEAPLEVPKKVRP